MERLLDIMRALRAPDGCPWDRAQTHESLRPYLLEEAAEAVDALASADHGSVADQSSVADELGDVLLQVAFHAVIAEEAGTFTYDDVEGAIVAKLERRHPHVFGATHVDDAAGMVRNWQAIKAHERAERGEPDGPGQRVPRSLPALRRAAELDRALGWAPHEELGHLRLGDAADDPATLAAALLYLAQRARRAGLDPELALRDHLARAAEGRAA